MAQPPFAPGGACGNLQRLQRVVAAQVHPRRSRIRHAPVPLAVGAVVPGHVLKRHLKSLNHALRRAMRDRKFRHDIDETDPAISGRRHAPQPQQILCL
jgi:cation diffusion facilitator CzcD-associated flavoprotein CzcO